MTLVQLAALSLPVVAAITIIVLGRIMTRHDQRAYDLHAAQEAARNPLKSSER